MKPFTPLAVCLGLAVVAFEPQAVPGQAPIPAVSGAQKLFEAGQYAQALQAVAIARKAEASGLPDAFLAAHAHLKLNQPAPARAEFERLVASADRVFELVGRSSIALVQMEVDPALNFAVEATAAIAARDADPETAPPTVPAPRPDAPPVPADPGVRLHDFHAFYQLGLVKARREDWAGAADAFERASHLHPAFAYAHYYAGLAYSRVKRTDRVATHFEQFLKLAPAAPERSAVLAILRSIRG